MGERDEIPGWEGSTGPSPAQYGKPHVYARDITSGAGNCVCGLWLGHERHVQAAPGVKIPERLRGNHAAIERDDLVAQVRETMNRAGEHLVSLLNAGEVRSVAD